MSKKSARHIGLSVSVAALACVAASSAFAADPAPKWCQGVKIAAFPGGPQGGVFANNVYNGFKQAELDLGPTVTYYFSDWDPNKMLTQIQQAVATKVDGIATYGFGGEPATAPLVRIDLSRRAVQQPDAAAGEEGGSAAGAAGAPAAAASGSRASAEMGIVAEGDNEGEES